MELRTRGLYGEVNHGRREELTSTEKERGVLRSGTRDLHRPTGFRLFWEEDRK